ncbi:MAG: TadE/TadG family type IV pilus assembly protein [Novosphingobium sp.]
MTFPRALLRDTRGVTVVEFALIAPVLLVLLMGIYDVGYQLYASSVLQGALQKAGRDATIEGAATTTSTIDQRVSDQIKMVVPNATLAFSRKAYATFGTVSKPEDFSDLNSNGTCDKGEPYEDINGNSMWDTDRGKTGQGGAKDAVLYSVTMTYPRPLAVAPMIGLSNTVTVKTETVLRNQPFGIQDITKVNRNCPP